MKPTNKSAQGLIEFNPYNKRLEISLPMRLIRQGFPSIELREQMRMVSVTRSMIDISNVGYRAHVLPTSRIANSTMGAYSTDPERTTLLKT